MANNCLLLYLNIFAIHLFVTQWHLTRTQEIDISHVIPEEYNSQLKPETQTSNVPFEVSVSVYINELLGVSEVAQSFHLDLFLYQEWYDHRLNVSQLEQDLVVTQLAYLNHFWLPDLLFVNSKEIIPVKALQSVQKLTITRQGHLNYMVRFNAAFSCPMDLLNYPHDYQYCSFKMSSLKYSQNSIKFVWKDLDVNTNADYPTFQIRSYWTANCDVSNGMFGNNSCLSGTLKLVRRLSYYVIRYYTLTFLSVVVTFIGFWLPLNAWPARANIMVSPLLSLISQDIAMNNEIGVSYTVSIHIYMSVVEAFVYLTILEYAVAIAWAHFVTDKKNYAKMLEQMKATHISTITPIMMPTHLPGYYLGNGTWFTACGRFLDKITYFFFGTVDFTREPYCRNKVDYVSRILFPFSFLLFVLIYTLATVIPWAANYN